MEERFNEWNTLKQTINTKKTIPFRAGEIYFMSVGQNIGYEIFGKDELFLRPVLVYKKLSKNTFIGIPLTSKEKIGSYFYTFSYKKEKKSTALLNQMRVFDIKRAEYFSGKIKKSSFGELKSKLADLLEITPFQERKGSEHSQNELLKCKEIISNKNINVNKKILITGGAGYIGSHTCIEMIEAGYDIVVYDNFSNSSKKSIEQVEKIVKKKISLENGDIRDSKRLNEVFNKYKIDSVIHFAGLKAVGESVEEPLKYYDNNVNGTLVLLDVMQKNNCKKIVFSSSATVYGDPQIVPIKEDFPIGATNPYGRSKLFVEDILKDLYIADNDWKIILLRYFNPVGAHESGLIGEDPNGRPNNLMPFISQTAVGKYEHLNVFGNDYDTVDGSGVRDYIHVSDLANGHLKAIEKIEKVEQVAIINLGTGKGYSVLEMIKAFSDACCKEIPFEIAPRRAGDIAECYADPSYAKEFLGWEAKKTLQQMCEDSWRWQFKNPNGYRNNND